MSFCELLKYLRTEKGVTQKEVAQACDITPTCICQLESGVRNPTGSTIKALASYFGCSADYLLGLEDDFGAKTVHSDGGSAMSVVSTATGERLTQDERDLIEYYRALNDSCKKLIKQTAITLKASADKHANQKNTKFNA
jgi:transcriptional regulator with XRE-family HTH domain